MDLFKILYPIEWVVAWLMYLAHSFFTWIGLDPASGLAWALSIVVLVIVMRIILIPLFFKQIRASRGMQMLAPEMQAIQKKYKGKSDPASREAMSRETMALYKKHGTNPFASCLPILAQSPIFFALFRVLTNLDEIASGARAPLGPIDAIVAAQAEQSTIFGAPLSSTFLTAATSSDPMATRIVTVVLVVAMSATTFLTQRQLTMKNMPPAALQGPMAQQQKVLLYVLPLVFAFSGVNFPIGVLMYWTTTNLWSMGQQFYTIRRMPTPGSEAERRMRERRARKGQPLPEAPSSDPGSAVLEAPQPKGQRTQPVRKDRVRAKPVDGSSSATTTGDASRAQRPQPRSTHTGKPGEPKPSTPASGSTGAQRSSASGATGGSKNQGVAGGTSPKPVRKKRGPGEVVPPNARKKARPSPGSASEAASGSSASRRSRPAQGAPAGRDAADSGPSTTKGSTTEGPPPAPPQTTK